MNQIDQQLNELGAKTPEQPRTAYRDVLDRIEQFRKARAPKPLVLTALLLVFITLCMNFLTVRASKPEQKKDLIEEMGLITNNSIYGGI